MPKKDETPNQLFEIALAGQVFAFPRDQDEWPTEAILLAGKVSDGRAEYNDVIEAVLGPDQWKRLVALPWRQFKEFLGEFSAAMDEINAE
jgi:hypothetical protein